MRIRLSTLLIPVALGCTPSRTGNGLQCVPSDAIDPMERQIKYDPYEGNAFFSDGRAMRSPPKGAVSRESRADDGPMASGVTDAGFVTTFPVPVTRDLLVLGRKNFDVICAACHGLVGDGVSVVAAQMSLRPPPSLVAGPIAQFPPGRIFQVATDGYGLMPSYRARLDVRERWAVAAYVRALVNSQNAPATSAPPGELAGLLGGT
jgi:mono/diheme cytochrome c family protein